MKHAKHSNEFLHTLNHATNQHPRILPCTWRAHELFQVYHLVAYLAPCKLGGKCMSKVRGVDKFLGGWL
jgi:hypothetical protein